MSSTKLFLDKSYEIDGVTLTGKQILDNAIENIILKEELTNATKE